VKTRTETRTRLVEHTIDGRTHLIAEPYQVEVTEPPRDWDLIVENVITGVAVAVTGASLFFSTTSIGALLAHVVPPAAAYAGAAIFDSVWLSCQGVEWLNRYYPSKADDARRFGNLALIGAMAAIAANGWLYGSWIVGLVSALPSALAKVLWVVVLRHHAKPLTPRAQGWIKAEWAELGAAMALMPARRRFDRARAMLAAEQAANRPAPGPDEVSPEDARVAIGEALLRMPDTDAQGIARFLSGIGVTVTEEQVRAVQDQAAAPGVVRSLRRPPGNPSHTSTIQELVNAGVTDLEEVLAGVEDVHGPNVNEKSVERLLRRVAGGA
jgi:hypothetical protein